MSLRYEYSLLGDGESDNASSRESDFTTFIKWVEFVPNPAIGGQMRADGHRFGREEATHPIVRLLLLESGEEKDPVCCGLEQHQLRNAPTFEALSYVWGGLQGAKDVFCSGRGLTVTRNLYSALMHLRYPDRERILWIDAVCINQEDHDERSSQVQLMGNIYSHARKVLVWLGEEDNTDCQALDMIKGLKKYFDQRSKATPASDKTMLETIAIDPNLPLHGWKHVTRLFYRAYFRRLWVIQEVANAREAILVYGRKTLPWDDLANAVGILVWLQTMPGVQRPELPTADALVKCNVMLIESCRKQVAKGEGLSFFDLLFYTNVFHTSEPRDRLYSLLGLPICEFEWVPLPDYRLSTADVFRNFTVLDLVHNKSLRTLSWVASDRMDQQLSAVKPSWVPDWNQPEGLPVFSFMAHGHGAGTSAGGSTKVDASANEDKTILTIKGRATAPIQFLGKQRSAFYEDASLEVPSFPSDFTDPVVDVEREWFTDCLTVLAKGRSGPFQQLKDLLLSDAYEEFLRTMCCDWDPPHQSAATNAMIQQLKMATWGLKGLLKDWDPAEAYRTVISQGTTFRKRFCCLEDGRLGWVPGGAAIADVVCVSNGAKAPHLLRPLADGTVEPGSGYGSGCL
jgi:hypothetical protein